MARNKHPEETVQRILSTAGRLFLEQGYDGTSLQDIIRETGLSKGAIYHHFSSKEDILEKICYQLGLENQARFAKIRDDKTMTGREKLREIFRSAMFHPNQQQALSVVPYLLDHPRFLAIEIRSLLQIAAPDYIQPVLEEGMADGSLQVQHPQALAEALLFLTDLWLCPTLQPMTSQDMYARCQVFNQLTQGMGLGQLLDEDVMEAFARHTCGGEPS